MLGKSIHIYLADATATGIRYAELSNWTGQGIACPRNRLGELAGPEVSKPGVYLLFESRTLNDIRSQAYIGESENVLERLMSHARDKDFWSEVVIFTSKDENLTKAHVKYLESTLVSLAKSADRYQLENANIPSASHLPRAERDAMEEFASNIRMVIGVLGYSILEPLLPPEIPKPSLGNIELTQKDIEELHDLSFSTGNVLGKGAMTDEGFVLKKGSQISKSNNDSMPGKLVGLRNQLLISGALEDRVDYFLLTNDVLFSSSSYAAAMVAGSPRSGPQSWRAANGKTLKHLEDSVIEANQAAQKIS